MALETRDSPAARSGRGVSPWVLVLSVLIVAVASACVGAWWAGEQLRAELTLRPPVVLFDMAGAVRGSCRPSSSPPSWPARRRGRGASPRAGSWCSMRRR